MLTLCQALPLRCWRCHPSSDDACLQYWQTGMVSNLTLTVQARPQASDEPTVAISHPRRFVSHIVPRIVIMCHAGASGTGRGEGENVRCARMALKSAGVGNNVCQMGPHVSILSQARSL